MAKFKVIVSDPEEGKSKIVELEGARAVPLIGKRLGETLDGTVVGMSGHKLQITGGSDKDGFPMHPNVHGGVRVRVILSKGVGFHPKGKGQRQRKTLRGNVVTEDIVQVNTKVLEKPRKAEKAKLDGAKPEQTEVVEPTTVKTADNPSEADAPPAKDQQ